MIESTGDWSGCELEEHIEEVRTRNEELARSWLNGRSMATCWRLSTCSARP